MTRKQKSEQWKLDNGWYLTSEQKSQKRMTEAKRRIDEMIAQGRDASLYIEIFDEAYPESKYNA